MGLRELVATTTGSIVQARIEIELESSSPGISSVPDDVLGAGREKLFLRYELLCMPWCKQAGS